MTGAAERCVLSRALGGDAAVCCACTDAPTQIATIRQHGIVSRMTLKVGSRADGR